GHGDLPGDPQQPGCGQRRTGYRDSVGHRPVTQRRPAQPRASREAHVTASREGPRSPGRLPAVSAERGGREGTAKARSAAEEAHMKSRQDRLIAIAMITPSLILLAVFVYGFI